MSLTSESWDALDFYAKENAAKKIQRVFRKWSKTIEMTYLPQLYFNGVFSKNDTFSLCEEEMNLLSKKAEKVQEEVNVEITLTPKAAAAALNDFMDYAESM